MKYLSLFIALPMLFSSCGEMTTAPCCVPPPFGDAILELFFHNADGANLLYPYTPHYYHSTDIRHYVVNDGQKRILEAGDSMVYQPQPNMTDYPNYSLFISKWGKKIANDTTDEGVLSRYESFLELDAHTVDTLRLETFEKSSTSDSSLNSIRLSKFWYNHRLIWHFDSTKQNSPFIIVK